MKKLLGLGFVLGFVFNVHATAEKSIECISKGTLESFSFIIDDQSSRTSVTYDVNGQKEALSKIPFKYDSKNSTYLLLTPKYLLTVNEGTLSGGKITVNKKSELEGENFEFKCQID